MKVWANFRSKDFAQQLMLSLKRLEPVARRVRALCLVGWQMATAMLVYIHAWQPRRYFVIHHRGNVTDIILYEYVDGTNITETVRTVKHVHDIDSVLKEMSHLSHAPLLYQALALPIMVVVQGTECEIKTFDLNKVPFWKRWEVVRRVEHSLIHNETARSIPLWIQKAHVRHTQQDVGGMKVVARHVWFGILKMNASLVTFEDWLQRQKRPVMAARWASLMLVEHLWLSLRDVAPWTIFVCPFENGGFQLFVYHHRALVLYRQGFLNTFVDSTIQDEVHQTLQYAERLGYAASTPFRVVVCDFHESQKARATPQGEWIWRQMPARKEWLIHSQQRWWQVWRSCFSKISLNQAELSPMRFISAWMAYRVPRRMCAIGMPVIHLMFWAVVVLWMKSSYLSHTLTTVTPMMEEPGSQSSQFATRVMHATCFDMFRQIYAHQPMALFHKVAPLLAQTGIIQRIHYDGSKQNEHSISFHCPNKMPKDALANLKKNLGEERYYVEHTSQGAQNILHVTERY